MVTFSDMLPKTLMLLGSGELGKELAIAAKRLGCKVIACDRYLGAPAMQVADEFDVFDMTNSSLLEEVVKKHNVDFLVPEIEALSVEALTLLEKDGVKVIPTANATAITMNRDKIRDLASNELNIKTARYAYASSLEELSNAVNEMTWPLFIKPVMSSSGKGQSLINSKDELETAWESAIQGSRGRSQKVIVEEFIDFQFEITLLTIRQRDGHTIFCPPIGHEQINGDYQCSWQPMELSKYQLERAQFIAKLVTDKLGGEGIFGVEFFITKDDVIFSELSPRPHDTGLVTLVSQNLSEFELHLRAILGLPIPSIICKSPGASRVVLADNDLERVAYKGVNNCLSNENVKLLIFGKPNAKKGRRMAVVLATGVSCIEARINADESAKYVKVVGIEDI